MKRTVVIGTVALISIFTAVACSPESVSIEASPSATVADAESSALSPKEESSFQSMGEFVSGEHPTTGTATLVAEGDTRYVEFSDQFQTDSGPDLFVVLHRSPDVIGTTAPPAYSIQEGDYVLLAPLQAVSGSQRYEIPPEVDLSQYASVAIWCRQFNATFGAASLQ